MTDINPRPVPGGDVVTDDPSWLYSPHGVNANLTATLDISLFTAQTHYADGFIPSGTPLARKASTGLYGPYSGANDDLGVCAGFLYAPLQVGAGTERVTGALYHHGVVVEANLPLSIDSNGKADLAGAVKFI